MDHSSGQRATIKDRRGKKYKVVLGKICRQRYIIRASGEGEGDGELLFGVTTISNR